MAPIKFEEHVRQQLDKREIRPSAESWDKLSSRLDKAEKRPKGKWWLSVAAAVAILAIASLIFIDQQNETATPIVESPSKIEESGSQKSENFEEPVQVASEEQDHVQGQMVNEVESPLKNEANSQYKEAELGAGEIAQNSTSTKRIFIEPISIEPPGTVTEKPEKFSDQINELLAKVTMQEKQSGDISEAEINKLLGEAASKISNSEKYSEANVNAEELLADVEFEMDQSFRQEVFEVLKEGLLKARTAIVTRNE